jgi:sugar (pentulose or hexulose) kinase
MDTVLAIDQSTSATKALILDLRAGRVVSVGASGWLHSGGTSHERKERSR